MALFAIKVLLAPAFVVGVSLAERRFGRTIGGVLAGLPIIAGPILLVYALQDGHPFAAHAAAATVLGLMPLTLFTVVYARLARHRAWPLCVLAGWVAFALATLGVDDITAPRGIALLMALAALCVGAWALPAVPAGAATTTTPAPPAWDLPARAVCAGALVLTLTALAEPLGARLSGLLVTFPVVTPILAGFTHDRHGPGEVTRLLRGMLTGFATFALFSATLAITVDTLSLGAAFAISIAVSLVAQVAAVALSYKPASSPPAHQSALPG